MNSVQPADSAIPQTRTPSSDGDLGDRSLSRSPQPYHRRSASLVGSEQNASSIGLPGDGPSASIPPSSCESGTEADDERGKGFLKGLPAPPLRARKGLRGGTPIDRTPGISPLPTPPILKSEQWTFPVQQPTSFTTTPSEKDLEQIRAREKYIRRKRAEIIRRIVEVFLLLVIGLVTARPHGIWARFLLWWSEIRSHFLVTTCLYIIYPFRQTYALYRNRNGVLLSLQQGFRIPSRFDAGPLLYPVFLPLIVSISLLSRSSNWLLANSILGLASLPENVIPRLDTGPRFNVLHWFTTLVPLMISQNSDKGLPPRIPYALKLSGGPSLTAEDLTLLYPLQFLTTRTVYFLTTTSLDPAELQLLSAALINLLLFAITPQAEILKALLWVGGIALFITCRRALGWEVALARVPSWRFRRSTKGARSTPSKVRGFDAAVCKKLVSFGKMHKPPDSSASEEDDEKSVLRVSRGTRLSKLRIDHRHQANGAAHRGEPASAVDRRLNSWSADGGRDPNFSLTGRRRHTFSIESPSSSHKPRTTPGGRPRRALSPDTFTFLTFTEAQARVRKWLYAIYTYIMVCFIILAPIRGYVSRHALSGKEPFGWALGYLLGDNPQFRFWTVSAHLERWICLPDRLKEPPLSGSSGWVDSLRQNSVGAANTRLAMCVYCAVVLVTGIATVLGLTSVVEVDTRRKVFHGIMVAMLLPTVFVDPCFVALALTLILAIFLLLDLFRASQLPPISRPLTHFLAPYVDGRDHRGPVIISHIFLLIGCAVPLWLSLAGAPRSGLGPWMGWDVGERDVSMVSGVICVGMGDAAASLIGRRYGRHKWLWSGGKSLEGSVAFTVAVTVGLVFSRAWLLIGGWAKVGTDPWVTVMTKVLAAAAGASLTEAVLTSCNDNVVPPVALWLLVRGLGI
jgi:dolichol kinase